jgi:hypothetical protein
VDGKPLSRAAAWNEQNKLDRMRDADHQWKGVRFAKVENDRSYLTEIPDAFDFRITGVDQLPTGPAWVLDAEPREGYKPQSRYAYMFRAIRGTLWIDQRDQQWVKFDAFTMEPITSPETLVRIEKGSHIVMEQMKLPGGDWVPKSALIRVSDRKLALFKRGYQENITYSDYRVSPAAVADRRNALE